MSEDAGYAERFLSDLLAAVAKPISDLRLLTSGLYPLPFALSLVGALLLALCSFAEAQQPTKKIPRVGFVPGTGDVNNPGPFVGAFRRGLSDLGYTEGKNIHVEYRYVEGRTNRTPDYLNELVELKVDVIVSSENSLVRAAKKMTKTIPVVMVINGDPVANGFIDSLARPGGNITGLTRMNRELSGKRIELLMEVVPRISKIGVLSAASGIASGLKEYQAAARALKIQFQSLEVRAPNPEIERAFRDAVKQRVSAVITVRGSLLNRYSEKISELLIKNRLPSMHERNEDVEAGGLMSYAASDAESFKRAAVYVDKILKGTKPADLPVEQPTKFEFVINLKTAKALNLAVPQSVLFRADRVIK
jgi:putative tryptophan/tyrosine transport system substrate-binding protein